jgi:phosphatidylinositol alpha 1,6-mannosyltransferase
LQRFCEDGDFRVGAGRAGVAEAARYRWERINQTVLDTYLRVIARTHATTADRA